MKNVIIYIMCFIISIIFLGCSKEVENHTGSLVVEEKTTADNRDNLSKRPKKTIALVMKTLTNPFFIDMEKGARKAEAEFKVNLLARTGAQETSIEQQIAIVEELIDLKVDAIVIAPVHSAELVPVLKKAQDAKIPIVNIDNRLDVRISKEAGLVGVPFVGVDNELAAYQSVKYVADKITKPTKAVIIEGIRGSDNSEQRKRGALRALNQNRNIDLVAIQTANWKIDEAYFTVSQIFKKYPDIGLIVCGNDMMALGVVEYLAKENKNNVLVTGFDALQEALQAIQEGAMQVSVNQQADIQGYKGVAYAVKLSEGEQVPEETYIPVKIVNAENVK
ncbi:substrate-binding domain-containing protein [Petroclostridium sp. X23]|uniref:substrate-binding domain-containing protein n=1 Tax=Petroclostridium sp. X23 TaxID=3045146 RepID=UPI0024ADCDDB|nr:substrate-binding domain-containing protein [Petroclostridium sp. X23]WHH60363.1 substrate-binding domain-containing protein [Petroclostridium sp. X23]